MTYIREEKNKAERLHTIIGWIVVAIVLVIIALVLVGPCDPQPEPIPAGPVGTTSLPLTDLRDLPDMPPESESEGECTGETSGTGTGSSTTR